MIKSVIALIVLAQYALVQGQAPGSFKGGNSSLNPNSLNTLLPNPADGVNYIRGDTQLLSNTVNQGDFIVNGYFIAKGGKSAYNPDNWSTHFPWVGDGTNYIRGDTEMRGNMYTLGALKVRHNIPGWPDSATITTLAPNGLIGASFGGQALWSHFPWNDQNTYIRPGDVGKYIYIGEYQTGRVVIGSPTTPLEIRGQVEIAAGKFPLNPQGLPTQFGVTSEGGRNYIRGNTVMQGDVDFAGDVGVQGNVYIKKSGKLCFDKECFDYAKLKAILESPHKGVSSGSYGHGGCGGGGGCGCCGGCGRCDSFFL